jgi:methionyl-tRNA synthetase
MQRPKRAVVTAGMPYANGPLHLGHLAGAHLPADIQARFLGMWIGRENVLFVSGTDDHGSASEIAALREGKPIAEFVNAIHARQAATLQRYSIGLDAYSGVSRPDCAPIHTALCQTFIRKLLAHGLLHKRTTRQWYDPQLQRFLPDRLVRGGCPNPKCNNRDAYSDECEVCGHQHAPTDLIAPRSALSSATPEMRETAHLWLDMWAVAETLRTWVQSKQNTWRKSVVATALDKLLPSVRFSKEDEHAYRDCKEFLPAHRQRYAQGGRVELQLATRREAEAARETLARFDNEAELVMDWSQRSITRDIAWGVPLPDIDPELAGKTLYVWPDSLLAPISFSQVALRERGLDPDRYREFWCDPESRIYQFLGQDNVFFYVLMQGSMWLGMQDDPQRLPVPGELQLTDVYGCFHLLVQGEKMSKSRGNFYTGDQLLDEKGYSADQIRYYIALLGLPEKPSDFDFDKLDERNRFLAGPLNAAFERPISAAHSRFEGRVPEGRLLDETVAETSRMTQRYVRAMERASYPGLLFELENYARKINSLFTQYKPHDDRRPLESRRDALYTSFYVLKNLMIMLYPFVPSTMERLRSSLALPESVFRLSELDTPIASGHALAQMQSFFPVPQGEASAARSTRG